ncbi:MAG TPA: ABC transporter substrate-binding protein [Longimicrobiaceae bacterium]|nr:ABC transporter substrate-binding protein [Longimicrobiaceae bacterium]
MGTASRLGWVAAAVLLAACGGGGDAGGGGAAGADAGAPVNGGTAVVAVKSDFGGFNPVTNSALATDDVIKFMLFTPLVQFDDKFTPQPYLAESWQLADSSVTFKIRQGVTWHDGKPLTAEDVKFTFDLAKNPESAAGVAGTYLGLVESATVLDPHTIRFDFVAPHAQPLEDFWWAPVPKHLLQSVPPSQLAQAPYNLSPVGSGPFKFGAWQQGQQLVLEAYPQFPQAMGGRPRLDRVVFRITPEATTRLTELTNGAVDVDYSILPDEAQQLQSQQGIKLERYTSREMTYIGWNNGREPFNDPAVRRAMTLAVDRARIIEALMFGFAKPAGSVIAPVTPLAPDLAPLPANPAEARQLLAQAGWRDGNGDGIVEKNGKPLRFIIITNASNKLFQDIATVVQQQLRAVGADAQLRTIEFQTLLQQHRARDYDAIITNWTWDYFRPDPTPLFSCVEARKERSANRAGYCNPQADQLMQAGLRETDPARAKQVWTQFSQVIQQDQPITLLYWTEEIAGVGPRLQGAEMDARSKLVNAPRWWIPANRRR